MWGLWGIHSCVLKQWALGMTRVISVITELIKFFFFIVNRLNLTQEKSLFMFVYVLSNRARLKLKFKFDCKTEI